MVKRIACAVALSAASLAPAVAQQSALVNVDLRNVAGNIAQNLKVDVSQIPVTVRVPVSEAATVCGVAASVLGQQAAGGAGNCTARSTSAALDQAVQQQIRRR